MREKVCLGIDLGTTYTVLTAKIIDKSPITLLTETGSRLIPSIVHLDKKQIEIGEFAQDFLITDPENTYYSTKRFIGRTASEMSDFSSKELQAYKYSIIVNENSVFLNCPNQNKQIPVQYISSIILKESLKIFYESFPKNKYELVNVVVTVPSYFNSSQRAATFEAAQIAGMEKVEIINEPTVAAIAYGGINGEESNNLIFDLGGGTFDISLVNYDGDGFFDVIASSGDNMLGGDDFDFILSKIIKEKCLKVNPKVLLTSEGKVLIKEHATLIKKKLSTRKETLLNVSSIAKLDNNPLQKSIKITRKDFEKASSDLVKKIEKTISSFLKLPKVQNEKIDNVVLIGGSSRLPIFKDIVRRLTSKNISKNLSNVNPDEIVSYGASLCAEYSHKGLINFSDVTPLDLGIECINDFSDTVVEANTKIPCRYTNNYTTVHDFQESILFIIRQGNRKVASENIKLGDFVLDGIIKKPKGKASIQGTIEIDSNGMLKAYALDKISNSQNQVNINNYQKLSKDEIQKLKDDAEKFFSQDENIIKKNILIDIILEKIENGKIYLIQEGSNDELLEELSRYESEVTYEKDLKELTLINSNIQYLYRNKKIGPYYKNNFKDTFDDAPVLKDPFEN